MKQSLAFPTQSVTRHRPKQATICRLLLAVFTCAWIGGPVQAADDESSGSEQVYNLRPKPTSNGRPFGHIGPTGIHAYIHKGLKVTVEEIAEGSPAEGKVKEGDVVLGVNGTALKGHNVFVLLGRAITEAEASDGKLRFELQSGEAKRQVTVTIPVLGAYSETWPVDCSKSKTIIDNAAAYYHQRLAKQQQERQRGIPGTQDENRGIPGALMGLFLLSTGDDDHLPVIKEYFRPFIANPEGIGDHTWNNGYNGILCAEYYLRSGDKDLLPVLQYYCDNAAERQKFASAWPHWGKDINPRYVAGGLMNPASAQVFTTLLLAKECGVDVDEATLTNSLRYFYRFVGHGTVPYGDHRSEGGLGSNGKDGMISAAMQVAAGARGKPAIYQSARDYLSMSTLKSYPNLATGHGDNGRGDGIWRGISAAYLREKKPEDYRAMMDRLTWWYDLSRFHNGAMGLATIGGFNDPGSGAGVMLAYTAHRKALRITGAPRSKHAVTSTLPETLWGRPADRAFHSLEHHPKLAEYGEEMPPHKILRLLGNAYRSTDPELDDATLKKVLQNVYHHRYMFRSQACKLLVKAGRLDIIESLLSDPDPRLRRAALDGILDWRYWFAIGKNPLDAEKFTPEMIDAIVAMLTDPDEALLVVDGALFAISLMPPEVVARHRAAIMPWTDHDEWWLRHGAFAALARLSEKEELYTPVLPTLLEMMVNEYHTQPRDGMTRHFDRALQKYGPDSAVGRTILEGLKVATATSRIVAGPRSREGSYNVKQGIKLALRREPESALAQATLLSERFDRLGTGRLLDLLAVSGKGRDGFFPVLSGLQGEQKQALTDLLYDVYLPELMKRQDQSEGVNLALIDAILALKQLKGDVAGWQAVGAPEPSDRVWRFTSVDPMSEDDRMPRRERKRFRDIELPAALEGWFKPGFDASDWNRGHAPIGIGEFKKGEREFPARSEWGEGEFLLARSSFTLDTLDHDLYRLCILNNQGFHIYLNGTKINSYVWWNDTPRYWKRRMTADQAELLKKGSNTLAVYANVEFPSAMKPHRWDQEKLGHIDVYIEGLRLEDLDSD